MKNIFLGLVMMLIMQSCSDKLQMNKVVNTNWTLTEWPGKALPTTATATLKFDADGKIGGKSFCNGYGGNTVFTDGGVKFTQIFGTKMYCEAVGDAENKYYADLEAVNAAKIVDGKLQLLKDGILIMGFTKGE